MTQQQNPKPHAQGQARRARPVLALFLLGAAATAWPALADQAGAATPQAAPAPAPATGAGAAQGAGPASKPTQTPSMAFENAPGVLGTSIRTLRLESLKAYATESLGAVALGLEDLRLSPTNTNGFVLVNLGDQIEFDVNSTGVSKTSRRLLDGIGRLLAENPDTKVQISSHTDDQGDAGYNLRLSQRRADTVKDYLIGRGVAATRITAIGKGESAPLVGQGKGAPSRTERAKNRRTELLIEPMEVPEETRDSDQATAPDAEQDLVDPVPPGGGD